MIRIASNTNSLWSDVRSILLDRSAVPLDTETRVRIDGRFTEADKLSLKDSIENVGLFLIQCDVITSVVEEENRMDILISTKKPS